LAYIYKHTRKDNGEVFYVGLSLKNDPKHGRAYSRGDRRNTHWKNIVNNTEYEVHIIEDNLTPDEAIAKEKEYIALYGRKDLGLGTLCNFTDGGEGGLLGYRHTEEYKMAASERMKGENNPNFGKTPSQEAIQKGIESRAGFKHSEETKAKLRELRLGENNPNWGKVPSDETRERMSKASTGRKHSEETKRKMSEMFSGENGPGYGKVPSQETRDKISIANKGRKASEETIEKRKEYYRIHGHHMCGRTTPQDVKDKISESNKGKIVSDETKYKLKITSAMSKVVLNKDTGIFYISATEAYEYYNKKYSFRYFAQMLQGTCPNKTSYIYA